MAACPTETESTPEAGAHIPEAYRRRVEVLHETVNALASESHAQRWHAAARENVRRWRSERMRTTALSSADPARSQVGLVLKGDWGVVTRALSQEHSKVLAMLNMANADEAGGGYREGFTAQEENMFRCTDCHFSLGPPEVDPATGMYVREASAPVVAERSRIQRRPWRD